MSAEWVEAIAGLATALTAAAAVIAARTELHARLQRNEHGVEAAPKFKKESFIVTHEGVYALTPKDKFTIFGSSQDVLACVCGHCLHAPVWWHCQFWPSVAASAAETLGNQTGNTRSTATLARLPGAPSTSRSGCGWPRA